MAIDFLIRGLGEFIGLFSLGVLQWGQRPGIQHDWREQFNWVGKTPHTIQTVVGRLSL
jgi:hypothetical protein